MEKKIINNKTILSIETSGKVCSVALAEFDAFSDVFIGSQNNFNKINFELIAEYSINVGNKHDKYCAELCSRILKDNNYDISDIDTVAVSVGPGSFTGIRIGNAVAKGICFDLNNEIPLIAVPTLTALVNNAIHITNIYNSENIKILAIIPSHSNLVYYQLFDKNGKQLTDIELVNLEILSQKYCNDNLIITTNSPININFGIYIPTLHYISAASISKLGAMMYLNNEITNSIDIQPLYIQEFIPK